MEKLSRRRFLSSSGIAFLKFGIATSTFVGSCRKRPDEQQAFNELTMQSAWVNDAEFMGYFIAIENGYYREERLDLKYLAGGPDVIPEGVLLAKKAQIALTTPDTTVNLIVKEKAPLRIIGTQYQKSPLGVVSLAESQISEPKDLVGKTLAVPPVNILSVEAMLKLNDISPSDVKIVPYQYDPTPLIMGEVNATIDFVTNVPYTVKQRCGKEVSSFLLYDHGFTIFNDTVVVEEETLRTRRQDLVSWLRASRKGWEENFKNPDKYAPQFMNSWFKPTGRTLENELFFNQQQRPLIESPDGIFSMSPEGIEANVRALNEIGLKAEASMFLTDLLEEV